MQLQETFNIPVKTPGAVVGNEKQPGDSISCGKASFFPKMVDSSFFLFQFAGDRLQPALNFAVQISCLKDLFQIIIHYDYRDGKIATKPELNGADRQDMTNGFGGAVSF